MQLQAGGTQSLLRLDEDLISWNGNMSAVFDRISRMAVVGLVSSGGSGIPVEFEFAEPGGTGARVVPSAPGPAGAGQYADWRSVLAGKARL
jgi:hypothetical protein